MFVMVFQGSPTDAARLRPAWSEVTATGGWDGAVAGLTAGGEWIGVLVSETEAPSGDARAVLSAGFADPPGCFGSVDVEVVMAGLPPKGAGFVQVMQAVVTDRDRWAEVDAAGVPRFAAARPDFLGSLRIWQPGNHLTVVDSFTSEAEARAGEAMPPPPEDQPVYEAWFGFMSDVAWYDLTDPWRD